MPHVGSSKLVMDNGEFAFFNKIMNVSFLYFQARESTHIYNWWVL